MSKQKQVPINMKTVILMLAMLKTSFALSMLHLTQLYNSLGISPQQTQVNPSFLRTPAQLLQNQLAQIGQLQTFQLYPNYILFANQLMQPRLPQTQIFPTYPFFGNLLAAPSGLPSTQGIWNEDSGSSEKMLPVMFAQVAQQGLHSASDSEESILSGVIMMPVDTGLQGNVIPVLHPGVTIDSGILVEQGINPVGQQGINATIPSSDALPVPSALPDMNFQGIVPGAGIIKPNTEDSFPTYAPPNGLQRTPAYVEPTAPAEVARGDMAENHGATENWLVCNSYIPESPSLNDMVRADDGVHVVPPSYIVIENAQDNQNQI